MKMNTALRTAALSAAAATALALTACAPSEPTVDEDAPVTIVVSNKPPADRPEELALFEQRLEEFEAQNENITVEGSEVAWDAQSFQALLAAGDLPTVLTIPFTEPQSLIARGQISDITDELAQIGLTDVLNPAALTVAQDSSGRTYGVPIDAYAIGLVYNRDLFEQAGLDPDQPPTTWDEVRTAAKQIADTTGVAGFAQMTTGNTGGWMFTANVYSFGGTVQSADGSEATFDDQPARDALAALQAMRWEDDSMGDNFLYDMSSISQDFAAGRIGMFIGAPANYTLATVLYGADGESIGLAPMPQQGGDHGTLSGGALQVVSPDATPEQRLAAAKWIAYSLEASTVEEKAVAAAAATAAQGLPVGLPGIPVINESNLEEYLGWIEEYINVPVENFAPYTATVNSITLTPEPSNKAQEVYALLDSVVQAVLTEQTADIDALLTEAAKNVDALLAR